MLLNAYITHRTTCTVRQSSDVVWDPGTPSFVHHNASIMRKTFPLLTRESNNPSPSLIIRNGVRFFNRESLMQLPFSNCCGHKRNIYIIRYDHRYTIYIIYINATSFFISIVAVTRSLDVTLPFNRNWTANRFDSFDSDALKIMLQCSTPLLRLFDTA